MYKPGQSVLEEQQAGASQLNKTKYFEAPVRCPGKRLRKNVSYVRHLLFWNKLFRLGLSLIQYTLDRIVGGENFGKHVVIDGPDFLRVFAPLR